MDQSAKAQATSLSGQLLGSEVAEEERDGLLAVDLEPVGADEVLLVEHGVVRAQEVEVLELKILSCNFTSQVSGVVPLHLHCDGRSRQDD